MSYPDARPQTIHDSQGINLNREVEIRDDSNYDDGDVQIQNHLIFDYEHMNKVMESSSNKETNSKRNIESHVNSGSPSQVTQPIYSQNHG